MPEVRGSRRNVSVSIFLLRDEKRTKIPPLKVKEGLVYLLLLTARTHALIHSAKGTFITIFRIFAGTLSTAIAGT